jgi:6-pyruvoyl-tetrahydropterin synthase
MNTHYHRTFHISIAHFNDQFPYVLAWSMASDKLHQRTCAYTNDEVLAMMHKCHGHDLKVEVLVEGFMEEGDDWLVDDPEMESVVKAWDNCNVSLHPDFLKKQLRATTENMARLLQEKMVARFKSVSLCVVRIYETADIYVTYGGKVYES